MTEALILFFAIIPVVLLAGFSYVFYRKSRPLEAIVFLATLIHETILVFLPCVYAVVNNFVFEKDLRFENTPEDLLRVMIIENIYIIVFLVPFVLFLKLFKRPKISFTFGDKHLYRFFALLSIIGIIVYLYQIINRPTLEEIIDSYSQSGLVGGNKIITFFTITFDYFFIVSATILLISSNDEKIPKSYRWIGLLMILFVFVVVLVSGVRGRIIWIAEFVFLISIFKKNYKPLVFSVLFLIILIPLNNILLNQIRPISEEIAKEGGINADAIIKIGKVIFEGVKDDNVVEGPNIFESLAERAQAPRNSMALLLEWDEGRSPSLNLYKGVLFYFLPRSIMDRPVIGSPNDDFRDAAIYKIIALNYNYTEFTMGPMLASAHAYWEGGYFGVILIALISSLVWIIIFFFAYRSYLLFGLMVVLVCCCALLIDGFITQLVPLYALLSAFWKNILPLILVLFLYNRATSLFKKTVENTCNEV